MIISISGTPGSGKSTIAKALAEDLGLEHFSTGDFARKLAEREGLSLKQLSELAETDPSVDREIDDMTRELASKDGFIIDSRLAFHFLPSSLKLFVKCSPEIATRRIFRDALEGKRNVEGISSFEQALAATKNRFDSEMLRYRKYYGLDYTDESQYDIVIDTSDMTKEQAIQSAIDAVKKHLKKE